MKSICNRPCSLGYRLIGAFVVLFATAPTIAEEQDSLAIAETNFIAADRDGDGKLDQYEFRFLIDANAENNIGRAATIRRFNAYDRAFQRVDRNSDGSVLWTEVVFIVEQQQ